MDATTPTAGDGQLREPMHAFAELARITVNTDPPGETLRRVAELAKQTLGGVEDVSLTMIQNGHPHTVVFTGSLAIDLDERQYELGFGPCLDAAKTGQTLVVDHTSDDTPYREFSQIALRAGVQHTVSVGLPLAQRSIGGLNIYRTAEGPVPPAFVQHAEVFADYAAVAVNNIASYATATHETTTLRAAMESRAIIEQAKGILMGRDRCTADEAFYILRRISQQRNIKLRHLAQAIVDSGGK
jgi:GAF domain-containing protein